MRPLPNLADFCRTSNWILVPPTGFSNFPINEIFTAVIARLRIPDSRNVVYVIWKPEIPVLFHFLLFYSDKYQGMKLGYEGTNFKGKFTSMKYLDLLLEEVIVTLRS